MLLNVDSPDSVAAVTGADVSSVAEAAAAAGAAVGTAGDGALASLSQLFLLGALSLADEPSNALSLPTWIIHVASVVEWVSLTPPAPPPLSSQGGGDGAGVAIRRSGEQEGVEGADCATIPVISSHASGIPLSHSCSPPYLPGWWPWHWCGSTGQRRAGGRGGKGVDASGIPLSLTPRLSLQLHSPLPPRVVAMALVWQYGAAESRRAWRGLAWAMVPLLMGAMCACTWHFFYNSPQLEGLVVLQSFMTLLGNCTVCFAAFRIYKASTKTAP
ncbi:unnamed protein product [Closterium sp. NIES-65]|nr:unnamed protein product [Closterium sp. NIES-65]